MRVLQQLAREGPQGPTEIATAMELHKNRVFRILATFQEIGFVRQDEATGKYELNKAVVPIALAYLAANDFSLVKTTQLVADESGATGFVTASMVVSEGDAKGLAAGLEGRVLEFAGALSGKPEE